MAKRGAKVECGRPSCRGQCIEENGFWPQIIVPLSQHLLSQETERKNRSGRRKNGPTAQPRAREKKVLLSQLQMRRSALTECASSHGRKVLVTTYIKMARGDPSYFSLSTGGHALPTRITPWLCGQGAYLTHCAENFVVRWRALTGAEICLILAKGGIKRYKINYSRIGMEMDAFAALLLAHSWLATASTLNGQGS